MLPPFEIRNLRRLQNPLDPARRKNGALESNIIQIEASLYDPLVNQFPEAALTYMDEDDGEVITIGSGLELEQRLEDPVLMPTLRFKISRKQAQPVFNGSDGSLMQTSPAMHVFDIEDSETVIELWRNVQLVGQSSSSAQTFKNTQQVMANDIGLPVSQVLSTSSQHKDIQSEETRSMKLLREHGIEPQITKDVNLRGANWQTKFPLLPKLEANQTSNVSPAWTQDRMVACDHTGSISRFDDNLTETIEGSHEPQIYDMDSLTSVQRKAHDIKTQIWNTPSNLQGTSTSPFKGGEVISQKQREGKRHVSDCLTAEGKRHAAEAGARLRANLHPTNVELNNSSLDNGPNNDRWASYGKMPAPVALDSPLTLFDAFQEQIQKVNDISALNQAAKQTSNLGLQETETRDLNLQSAMPEIQSGTNQTLASTPNQVPEIIKLTMSSVVESLTALATDLRNTIAETRDEMGTNKSVPQNLEVAFRKAAQSFSGRFQEVANVAQDTSRFIKDAAERTREADAQALETVLEGLQGFAASFNQFRRDLLTASRPTAATTTTTTITTPATQVSPGGIEVSSPSQALLDHTRESVHLFDGNNASEKENGSNSSPFTNVSKEEQNSTANTLFYPQVALSNSDRPIQPSSDNRLETLQEEKHSEKRGPALKHASLRYHPGLRARKCRFSPTRRPQSQSQEDGSSEKHGSVHRNFHDPRSYLYQPWKPAQIFSTSSDQTSLRPRSKPSSYQARHRYRHTRSRSPSPQRRFSLPYEPLSPSSGFGQRGPIHLPKDWPRSNSEDMSGLNDFQQAHNSTLSNKTAAGPALDVLQVPNYPFGRLPSRTAYQPIRLPGNDFGNRQLKHRNSWHPSSHHSGTSFINYGLEANRNKPPPSTGYIFKNEARVTPDINPFTSFEDALYEQPKHRDDMISSGEEVATWGYERLGLSNDDTRCENRGRSRREERAQFKDALVSKAFDQDEIFARPSQEGSLARAHTTGGRRGHGRSKIRPRWQDRMSMDIDYASNPTDVDPLMLESTRYPSISQFEAHNYGVAFAPPVPPHIPLDDHSDGEHNSLYSEPSVRDDNVDGSKDDLPDLESGASNDKLAETSTLQTGFTSPKEPIAARGKRMVEERSRWLQETRRNKNEQSSFLVPLAQTANSSSHSVDWQGFLDNYDSTPGAFPGEDISETQPIDIDDGDADSDLEHMWQERDPLMASQPAPSSPSHSNRERSVRFNDQTTTIEDHSNTNIFHEHEDAMTVERVQECVESLRTLEFGKSANGSIDTERLIVYAQAANGDLLTAMEIIEEELKAHVGRCTH